MKAVIVYGPKACGKTRNKDKIAAKYGCDIVIDDLFKGNQKYLLEQGRKYQRPLFLTYEQPSVFAKVFPRVDFIAFDEAMA